VNDGQQKQKNTSFTDLGPLKDTERQDLNCAVKEYLLLAGYRLTAMTFYEEVGIAVLPFFLLISAFFWVAGGVRLVFFEKVAGYILSSTCRVILSVLIFFVHYLFQLTIGKFSSYTDSDYSSFLYCMDQEPLKYIYSYSVECMEGVMLFYFTIFYSWKGIMGLGKNYQRVLHWH
jgi:hypothetical protein